MRDMTCGFLQKHHQLVGLAPISIQTLQVKRHDIYIFSNHHIFFIYPCTIIAKRWGLRKENMLDFLT
jgi:hypothetical protein